MLLSLASCKPKNKKSEVVSADDPYFSMKEIEVYKAANNNTSVSFNTIALNDRVGILLDIYEYDENVYENPIPKEAYSSEYTEEEVLTEPAETEITEETSEDPSDEPIIEEGEEPYIDPYEYVNNNKRLLLVYDLEGNKVGETDLSGLFDASSYVSSIKGDGKGNIAIILESFDEQKMQTTQYLAVIDPSGKEIKPRIKLDVGTNAYISSVTFDAQGNIYIGAYADKAIIQVSDPQGKKMFTIEEENLGGSLYSIGGTVYVDSWGTGDKYEYNFYPIDVANKKLGEPIDMRALASGSMTFTDSGVYVNKAGGIYSFDFATQKEKEILSWNDTDIDLSRYAYSSYLPFSDEKFVMVNQYYDYLNYEGEQEPQPINLMILTKEKTNPNAGKEILLLGGLGIMYNTALTSQLYQYNKSNTKCRIEIKDYESLIDYTEVMDQDYSEWIKIYAKVNEQIYLDMINGDGPDILVTGYMNTALERFEAKGLLADLYELAAKDPEFNKENYVTSVLSLFEKEGKLYQFPTSFSLSGLVGPTRFIGNRTGWTVDEFNEMVNGLPKGVYSLVNITQSDLLTSCVSASLDSYVDYTKNEVRFDSADFYKLLEFAKTYGSDEEIVPGPYRDEGYAGSDYVEEGSYIDEWQLMSSGMLALTRANLYGARSVSDYRFNFGEPVTFVGYPSGSKSGLACTSSQKFAISEESANKDEAWKFVSYFIGEESQNNANIYYDTPILKSALDKQIDKLLNPPENEQGGEIIYDYGYGSQITQEDVDQYLALIDSVSMLEGGDSQILAIILEETSAYFKGLKTAEDVSKIIQDRVKTYVSERS